MEKDKRRDSKEKTEREEGEEGEGEQGEGEKEEGEEEDRVRWKEGERDGTLCNQNMNKGWMLLDLYMAICNNTHHCCIP